MPIDQEPNPNFLALQAAGPAGRFAGTLLEDFGQAPRGDKDNIQPRLGFAYDLRGNGRDIIRGGWGIYTDFGYTNSNVLTAAIDAAGGHGAGVPRAATPPGIRKAGRHASSGSADPLSTIASAERGQPEAAAAARRGGVAAARAAVHAPDESRLGAPARAPRRRSPPTTCASTAAISTCASGRTRSSTAAPAARRSRRSSRTRISFRTAVSKGESRYDALILGLRRRMSRGFDLNASYTLAKRDERRRHRLRRARCRTWFRTSRDPFADVQDGPVDAHRRAPPRHAQRRRPGAVGHHGRAVLHLPLGAADAHLRGARPQRRRQRQRQHRAGLSLHRARRRRHARRSRKMGPCETVNCSRRAPFSQLNLRVSRVVPPARRARDRSDRRGVQPVQRRRTRRIPLTTQRLSTPPACRRRRSCSRPPSPATSSSPNSASASSDSGSRSDRRS